LRSSAFNLSFILGIFFFFFLVEPPFGGW